MVSLVLVAIADIDRPYQGSVHVEPDAFNDKLKPQPVPEYRRPRDLRDRRRAALAHHESRVRAQDVERSTPS
jgi:hypothetical protein